jgi:hypothetical protein
VTVRLGAGTAETDWAMDMIEYGDLHSPFGVRYLDLEPSSEASIRITAQKQSLISAVVVIAQLTYWRRLWNIQEIILSITAIVKCGIKEINMDYP